MKKLLMGSVMALGLVGLSACGGGTPSKAQLVKACVEDGDGGTQEECKCMVDQAEENLSKDSYAKFAKAAVSGDAEAAMGEMMADDPELMGEFMGFAMAAAMTCGLS